MYGRWKRYQIYQRTKRLKSFVFTHYALCIWFGNLCVRPLKLSIIQTGNDAMHFDGACAFVHCAFGCVFICGYILNYILQHNWNLIAIILTILKLMDNWMVFIVHVNLFRTDGRYCIEHCNSFKTLLRLNYYYRNCTIRPSSHTCTLTIQQKILGCQPKCLINGYENEWICNFPSFEIHCPVLCIANVALWSLDLHSIAMRPFSTFWYHF